MNNHEYFINSYNFIRINSWIKIVKLFKFLLFLFKQNILIELNDKKLV